ncbi:MAG TPA: AMP-binding protein, partial [Gammaproteobacteria bacterium]|nr:AMP-binding protein [Gammaproteobacteria bacterium]
MPTLLPDLVRESAEARPHAPALFHKDRVIPYGELAQAVADVAGGLRRGGMRQGDRVAIYLPKVPEAVHGMFGTAAGGGAFVPVNPLLKPAQVGHILRDSGARFLITNADRADRLAEVLEDCPDLREVVITDREPEQLLASPGARGLAWQDLRGRSPGHGAPRGIDADMAAILYTSGSTGKPKGVVLSHRNLVAGAESVAHYLENRPSDRLLAVLPFSFDYGLSQLTTAFLSGAGVVLTDYLLPRDVPRDVARYEVTGLAAVPPLWNQLAGLDWSGAAQHTLRYITNSGGAMPRSTTHALQSA